MVSRASVALVNYASDRMLAGSRGGSIGGSRNRARSRSRRPFPDPESEPRSWHLSSVSAVRSGRGLSGL